MALILRNGGSQSPDRWLRELRNNHNTLKNLQKKAKESKQEYDDVTTEIKSLNDELKTTKDRIEELQNKDVLTIVEQEELDK